MGSSAKAEYCAFTKAVEHMGDRWSLLIVRELAMFGAQGFNTLASGLPGRISRSVLVARLRNLERLGLVARSPSAGPQPTPYELTPAGEQLVPTLHSLWQWAERWVPEDPGLAKRDPQNRSCKAVDREMNPGDCTISRDTLGHPKDKGRLEGLR